MTIILKPDSHQHEIKHIHRHEFDVISIPHNHLQYLHIPFLTHNPISWSPGPSWHPVPNNRQNHQKILRTRRNQCFLSSLTQSNITWNSELRTKLSLFTILFSSLLIILANLPGFKRGKVHLLQQYQIPHRLVLLWLAGGREGESMCPGRLTHTTRCLLLFRTSSPTFLTSWKQIIAARRGPA